MEAEIVILDGAGGEYYSLDSVGAAVWRELAAGRTVSEVAEILAPIYDVPRATLESDVDALVVTLLAKGLVVAMR